MACLMASIPYLIFHAFQHLSDLKKLKKSKPKMKSIFGTKKSTKMVNKLNNTNNHNNQTHSSLESQQLQPLSGGLNSMFNTTINTNSNYHRTSLNQMDALPIKKRSKSSTSDNTSKIVSTIKPFPVQQGNDGKNGMMSRSYHSTVERSEGQGGSKMDNNNNNSSTQKNLTSSMRMRFKKVGSNLFNVGSLSKSQQHLSISNSNSNNDQNSEKSSSNTIKIRSQSLMSSARNRANSTDSRDNISINSNRSINSIDQQMKINKKLSARGTAKAALSPKSSLENQMSMSNAENNHNHSRHSIGPSSPFLSHFGDNNLMESQNFYYKGENLVGLGNCNYDFLVFLIFEKNLNFVDSVCDSPSNY